MRIGRALTLLALALTLGSLGGCATKTSTTHLWQAEVTSARPPMRTMVVFAANMAEAQRRLVEQRLAAALGDHGVAAMPSYELFPEPPSEEQAKAELTRRGIEGVLVVSLQGVREQTTYAPGHYQGGGAPAAPGYHGVGLASGPGHVVSDQIVDAETSVWDRRAGTDRLVWSALTHTTNPSSGEDLTESMSKEILPSIAKAGIVGAKH